MMSESLKMEMYDVIKRMTVTVGTAESYSNVTQISVRAVFTFRFFYQNSGKR